MPSCNDLDERISQNDLRVPEGMLTLGRSSLPPTMLRSVISLILWRNFYLNLEEGHTARWQDWAVFPARFILAKWSFLQ
jgi:hypothetical protein